MAYGHWNPIEQTTKITSCKEWVFWTSTYTPPVEACHQSHFIHACSEWFWNKKRGEETRRPSPGGAHQSLPNWEQLGEKLYCWIKLGWNCEGGWADTSMRSCVSNQLVKYNHLQPKRPRWTQYAPALAVHGQAAQDLPETGETNIPRCYGKTTCPASSGQLHVFWECGGSNNISITEKNCITTSSANKICNKNSRLFLGLHGIKPGCNHLLLRLRHGP